MTDVRSEPDLGAPAQTLDQEKICAVAALVRPGLEGKRSDKLLRLFDFLLEQSLQGQQPTEQQIADEAFSDGRTNAPRSDANVRVYVHRLRKVLKDLPPGPDGDRLDLPVGSYMLRLEPDEPAEEAGIDQAIGNAPAPAGLTWRKGVGRILAVMSIVFVIGIAGWLLLKPASGARLADAMPWQAIAASDRPITLVMGDYYFFETRPDSSEPPRLAWDRKVPTREDLIIYQMLNPDKANRVLDTNQHYVSSGTLSAVFTIRSALRRDPDFRRRELHLTTASQVTPELLKETDVIYIGQLSGISAILRDPLVQASPFRLNEDLVSVTDMATGKEFRSDGVKLRDEQISRRDYGYIARLPGPAGNSLIVVAGLRDPGLDEMAEMVVDPARLAPLRSQIAQSPQGFETLYHVRTLGSANLGANPVLQRPIRTQGIWDRSANTPEYRPIAAPSDARR